MAWGSDSGRLPALAGGSEPAGSADGRLTSGFAAIVNAIRRYWLSTLILIVLGTALGVAVHRLLPTEYEATATVLIGGPQARQPELDSLVVSAVLNQDTLTNEVEILQSRALALRVIERLQLHRLDAFNPPGPEPGSGSSRSGIAQWLRDQVGALRAWAGQLPLGNDAVDDADYGRSEMEDVIDRFLEDVTIAPRGRSQVIDVTFRTEAPGLAALVANTLVEEYLVDRTDNQTAAARLAGSWLRERLGELRDELQRRETAVEDYRREAGLLQGVTASLTSERLSGLNSQLLEARAALAQASGRYDEAMAAREAGRGAAMAEVLQSETIRDLRAQESEIASEVAQFENVYGPQHPRMMDLRQHLAQVRRGIAGEVDRILASLASATETYRQRVELLEVEVAEVRAKVVQEDAAMARLRVLEREAEATRELYQDTLRRAEAADPTPATTPSDGRMLSPAAPPTVSTKPRLALMGGLGFVFGCGLALVTAVGRELLDRRFRTVGQAEAQLGLRVIGVVPSLEGLPGQPPEFEPEDTVVIYPGGAFAEAVRTVTNQLRSLPRRDATGTPGGSAYLPSDPDKDPPGALILAVTSSVQGEGKTMLAVSLARSAALSDQRVLLVDADMRLGRVHQALAIPATPGLADYLAEPADKEIASLWQSDPSTRLKVLTCGKQGYKAGVLLQSGHLRRAMQSLRRQFDLIIIDTPPVLPVADFGTLVDVADAALFIVDWSRMRPDVIEAGAARIRATRAGLELGVVINNVDVRKKAADAFPELEIYSSRYRNDSRYHYHSS
ncbi:MAG: polysaccharide biosynthesis tyrosine autokinase [Geminicoccaceae bacterium]|nr:polysaccharide biosynthesis tyrosine autokinase [Geminicoccaceae bacterium]MCB9967436.1 polysaccharide biosynthesis tyrosine autokinase [Geminicoccaceae bacterium]HRY25765.1 polysaccharide biosynthesis tyrosine autokinase [Geminicoccaceae bacterium]